MNKKKVTDEDDASASSEEDIDTIINDEIVSEIPIEIPCKDRIHVADDQNMYELPNLIELQDVLPGEPPYMKRKRIPNAIRIHKIKDRNCHEWLYSQILLYRPFQDEHLELKEAREKNEVCEELFIHPVNITSIKEN